MIKEIELLRAEMMQLYAEITQCNCILYTAFTAIIAYTFKYDNYLVSLFPYFLIVPIFFICELKKDSICRLSAYMYVFSDEVDYHWPHRMKELESLVEEETNKRTLFKEHLHYYVLSLVCYAFGLYRVLTFDYDLRGKVLRFITLSIITICLCLVFYRHTISTPIVREQYITKFNIIKGEELKRRQK